MVSHESNRDAFREALKRLQTRTNDDAFVIFEDRASQKFVQFAGSQQEPLYLDLPHQALSEEERARAEKLFHNLGTESITYPLYDKPGGQIVGSQSVFSLVLGSDVERAAELTARIFAEVFVLPDGFDLAIEEN